MDRLRSFARALLVVGGGAGAVQLNWLVQDDLGWSRAAVPVMAALVVGAVMLGGIAYYVHRLGGLREVVLSLGVGAFASGVLAIGTWGSLGTGRDVVRDYCMYGAVSQAQLDGCRAHVVAGEVFERDTPATRFARDVEAECGIDSGPFCERVKARRLAEALAPTP